MASRIDFASLAKRCRALAIDSPECAPLLNEVAAVLEKAGPAIASLPEVARTNRVVGTYHAAMSIADALDEVAQDYALGRKMGTAPGALRMFAASLRASQKPKEEEGAKKPALIVQ